METKNPQPVQPAPRDQIRSRRRRGRFRPLRVEVPAWQAVLLGALCLAVCGGLWWWVTRGADREERLLPYNILPSPADTFGEFPSLWFDAELTLNLIASLRRVVLGFGLACAVGVPLGVLCGCFRRLGAFFAPLVIMGRNIPVAAVIPLTMSLFGIDEFQKIMFIFIACVAFIIMDTATAVGDVDGRYIDTAYTLGAKRRQIIFKVLVPLAMPSIFNSIRLLFGLAFGYIMLAEVIVTESAGGLGHIINLGRSRGGHPEYILLVLMLIPLIALVIDRLLYWIQRQLFPYQYGGDGVLHELVRMTMHGWESVKSLVIRPARAVAEQPSAPRGPMPPG